MSISGRICGGFAGDSGGFAGDSGGIRVCFGGIRAFFVFEVVLALWVFTHFRMYARNHLMLL